MFNVKDWNIEEMTGYKPLTTLYTDFGIAEKFGKGAIVDTFERMFYEYKNSKNYKLMTELVMVLNWKIWEHYESNENLAKLYNELWGKADSYCVDNFEGEAAEYFYYTTD